MKVRKRKKLEELLSKIRHLIRSITENADDYDEKYRRIKFNLDDKLPLKKLTEIHNIILVNFKLQISRLFRARSSLTFRKI